jgi:adenylate cyclase
MTAESSPEIEAVLRRVIVAWQQGDVETISNLFSDSSHLRVLGFDFDEWWVGPEEFRGVFAAQATEMLDWGIEIHQSEAFEESNFGWGTLFTTLRSGETTTPMRHTAFLRLDSGSWRVFHWQNSIPVSNQQIWGVELTTGLDHLMDSVLRDDAIPKGLEGTATLEFTDIVDSTRLAESVGDVEWARLIHDHEAAIRRITESHDGTVSVLAGVVVANAHVGSGE